MLFLGFSHGGICRSGHESSTPSWVFRKAHSTLTNTSSVLPDWVLPEDGHLTTKCQPFRFNKRIIDLVCSLSECACWLGTPTVHPCFTILTSSLQMWTAGWWPLASSCTMWSPAIVNPTQRPWSHPTSWSAPRSRPRSGTAQRWSLSYFSFPQLLSSIPLLSFFHHH